MPHTRHNKYNDLFVPGRYEAGLKVPGMSAYTVRVVSIPINNKLSGGDICFLALNGCSIDGWGQVLNALIYYQEKLESRFLYEF